MGTAKRPIQNRIELINLLSDYNVPDIGNLIACLHRFGFFTAPASTKYHGAYPGGLYVHSFAVTKSLLHLTEKLELRWNRKESPIYIGLFHDLCKCDQYFVEEDKISFNKDTLLSGHGDKSVMMASQILRLTEEEVFCIRYHMGAFSDDAEEERRYSNAVRTYQNVLWTHTADMVASHIEGT